MNTKQGANQTRAKHSASQGANQTATKQGTSQIITKQGASQLLTKQGASRLLTKQGASQILTKQSASRTTRQSASRISTTQSIPTKRQSDCVQDACNAKKNCRTDAACTTQTQGKGQKDEPNNEVSSTSSLNSSNGPSLSALFPLPHRLSHLTPCVCSPVYLTEVSSLEQG